MYNLWLYSNIYYLIGSFALFNNHIMDCIIEDMGNSHLNNKDFLNIMSKLHHNTKFNLIIFSFVPQNNQ